MKNTNTNKTEILILAAGKGKRMQSDLPKVLMPLQGKPMLSRVLSAVHKAFREKPVAIVGHKAEMVKKEIGNLCHYALQKEQLGTGHAVSCAKKNCASSKHIMVLSGDQPFITDKTLKKLLAKHLKSGAKITFATALLPDFKSWRKAFAGFGRILRKKGKIEGIREYKDAGEKEKKIREVNAGCYVFEAKWLWQNLKSIKNHNAQGEYYLTDLFHIAFEEKEKVESVRINPHEALGANSKEELEILEKLAPKR